jgi:hypothetical protein
VQSPEGRCFVLITAIKVINSVRKERPLSPNGEVLVVNRIVDQYSVVMGSRYWLQCYQDSVASMESVRNLCSNILDQRTYTAAYLENEQQSRILQYNNSATSFDRHGFQFTQHVPSNEPVCGHMQACSLNICQ